MQAIQLSPEQVMLRETAESYLAKRYGFQERRNIIESRDGFDRSHWAAFAEMGWLGLPFPESYGGTGGTPLDLLLLMQTFGRALVVEPYLSTVVLGGMAVLQAGSPRHQERILPTIAAGQCQVAFGFAEPQSGYDAFDVRMSAARRTGGFTLNGQKAVVLGAPSADLFIVSARTSGPQRAPGGLSLFLVAANSPGVTLRAYPTVDGRRAAEVYFDDVDVSADSLLGVEGEAAGSIEDVLLSGSLALVGEAAGCLDGAVAATVSHLKSRTQFGQALASFQALRHRVADMFVVTEELKALARLAAKTQESSDRAERRAAVAAAKAYAGEAGRKVCEDAVQLHGAVAITDGYIVGHYLKRIIAIDRTFGDADHHVAEYVAATSRRDATDPVIEGTDA